MQKKIMKLLSSLTQPCEIFGPAVDLFIRLYLFKIYFNEGYRMYNNFQDTILQFTDLNYIPLIAPVQSAWIYTGSYLILPILLALGLGARLPAILMGILTLLTMAATKGASELVINQNVLQIFMIGVIIAHGHGRFSVDEKLSQKDSDYKY